MGLALKYVYDLILHPFSGTWLPPFQSFDHLCASRQGCHGSIQFPLPLSMESSSSPVHSITLSVSISPSFFHLKSLLFLRVSCIGRLGVFLNGLCWEKRYRYGQIQYMYYYFRFMVLNFVAIMNLLSQEDMLEGTLHFQSSL